MELTANLAKTGDELAEAKEEIKRKRQSVSLWSMPFDGYSRNELNEAKAELAEAQAKEKKAMEEEKKAMEEAKKLMLKMKTSMEVKPKFIGFKAMVSYRAKNNKGNILMSNEFIIFDKEIKEVVFMCDDNEYEQYSQAIKLIQEKFEATK